MKPTLPTRMHRRNGASTPFKRGFSPRWPGIPNRPASNPLDANTPGLSGTVGHLGRTLTRFRSDRPVSGPVVVSLGGQRLPHFRIATFCSVQCAG